MAVAAVALDLSYKQPQKMETIAKGGREFSYGISLVKVSKAHIIWRRELNKKKQRTLASVAVRTTHQR